MTIREQIRQLLSQQRGARRLPPILVQGETGSGKGLLASLIHRDGPRASHPFVDVNCAAIPDGLLEAELFGYERGAFTDARQAKPGLFQAAQGGTLFLDEIGLLPLALQAKLLKVLEERVVRRLGSTRSEAVDVWIIAATNEDLTAQIHGRRFREDLYHRLAVLSVTLPPLRQRGNDVILLAEHFLARACTEYGLPPKRLSAEARAELLAYRWPGNVRELSNVIERVALLAPSPIVSVPALGLPPAVVEAPSAVGTDGDDGAALDTVVESVERKRILAALSETGWNVSHAAGRLGITRNKLRYRIDRYGLRPGAAAKATPVTPAAAPPPLTSEACAVPAPASVQATAPIPPPTSAAGATTTGIRWERRLLAFLCASVVLPERHELVTDLTRQLDVLVEKAQTFGARIQELSSTGLIAVFGLEPIEDAPTRAVLAAVTIVKAIDRGRRAGRPDPGVRVVLHAGDFMIARIAAGAELPADARQHVAHVLSTVEATAEAGMIVATKACLSLLPRQFEFTPIRSAEDEEPLYRLSPQTSDRFNFEGRPTPLVGRTEELELLQRRLASALRGTGRVVGIVGEAGIGKSRLLSEFLRLTRGEPVVRLHAHCESYARSRPFWTLASLLRTCLGIDEDDQATAVRAKIAARLGRLGLSQRLPEFLALLDPTESAGGSGGDPGEYRRQIFEACRELLHEESRAQPLVLVLEDLQWSDAETQAFLDDLVPGLAASQILLLLAFRPDYRHPWSVLPEYSQLRLTSLSRELADELLVELIGSEGELETLKQLLLERTDGNPFFLEETVRTLIETGVLFGARGAYRLGRPVQELVIPSTVRPVLAARIDRLAPEDRQLLQMAAVIGRVAPRSLLEAVAEVSETAFRRGVQRLQEAEFLYESPGASGGVYVFRQPLTLEVAYHAMAPAQRQALHRRVMRALERLLADRANDNLQLLAYHALRGEAWDRATRYLYLAGESRLSDAGRLAGLGFSEAAVDALERLGGSADPAIKLDAYLDLWAARLVAGATDGLRDLMAKMETTAVLLGDRGRLARVRLRQGQAELGIWSGPNALERARDYARGALGLADEGDLASRSEARFLAGLALRDLGRGREAIQEFAMGVELLEGDSSSSGVLVGTYAALSGWHAEACAAMGEFGTALASARRGLAVAEAARQAGSHALGSASLGYIHLLRGELEVAHKILDGGRALAEEHESSHGVFATSLYLACCLLGLGKHDEGVAMLMRGLRVGVGDAFTARWTRYHAVTAAAYLAAGLLPDAEAEIARGLTLARACGARGHEPTLLRLHADLLITREPADLRTALREYEESLALAGGLGLRLEVAEVSRQLGLLYRRTRDRSQAERYLSTARRDAEAMELQWVLV